MLRLHLGDQRFGVFAVESDEPITAYGLMFGRPVEATLGELDYAFRDTPARTLIQLAGLGTVLGTGFDMAFGGGDMRTRAVAAAAYGPIATELDSRGIQFPFEENDIIAAFEDWLAALSAGGPDVDAIPTHRLVIMVNIVAEALAWLGPEGHPLVTVRLRQALLAANSVLSRRGVTPATHSADKGTNAERSEIRREPVSAFIAYSHKDEEHRDRLVTHLSTLRRSDKLSEWHDRKIVAGQDWERVIDRNLERSKIILLLVSSDFIASDYCFGKEMRRALERHVAGDAVVIPIVIRPTYVRDQPFTSLQMLPSDAKAVTTWKNRDNAWVNVVAGIDLAIAHLTST